MAVYLGTAGYTNRDWLGRFYGLGTRPSTWLGVYAAHFRAVELNSTFYGLPRPTTLARMVTQTAGRVRFALKLPQSFTHRRDAGPSEFVALRQAVQPLRDTGTLGPLVAQFPFSFGHNPSHWAYVTQLVESIALEGVVVEFRHASWHRPSVREGLRALGVGWVSPDYPTLPGLPSAELHILGTVAYLRLHGRNQATWWTGQDQAERHDYSYTAAELAPWVTALVDAAGHWRDAWVIFCNTTRGQALDNLTTFRGLMRPAGLQEAGEGVPLQPVPHAIQGELF